MLPAVTDLAGLAGYVLSNPYLFISSSTVMTTGLILAAALVGGLAFLTGRGRSVLHQAGPSLAVLLAYFGVGSLALSLQIYLRFNGDIPGPVGIQLQSGLAHFAEALLGLALLAAYLRGRTRREWLTAHFVALSYWLAHVVVLTPPWFEFQGQRELILGAALVGLGVMIAINSALWVRMERGQSLLPDLGGTDHQRSALPSRS